MLNQDQIQGKWTEFKGGVRNLWGQITDDELNATQGNITAISGIVQRKYGETKETVKEKMDRLLNSFDNDTDAYKDNAKSSYERNPVQERTSSTSQNQDLAQSQKYQSERKKFDKETFDASQESLDDAQGSTNNSYMNPNREKIGKDLNQ